jgi:hypothetical protein
MQAGGRGGGAGAPTDSNKEMRPSSEGSVPVSLLKPADLCMPRHCHAISLPGHTQAVRGGRRVRAPTQGLMGRDSHN